MAVNEQNLINAGKKLRERQGSNEKTDKLISFQLAKIDALLKDMHNARRERVVKIMSAENKYVRKMPDTISDQELAYETFQYASKRISELLPKINMEKLPEPNQKFYKNIIDIEMKPFGNDKFLNGLVQKMLANRNEDDGRDWMEFSKFEHNQHIHLDSTGENINLTSKEADDISRFIRHAFNLRDVDKLLRQVKTLESFLNRQKSNEKIDGLAKERDQLEEENYDLRKQLNSLERADDELLGAIHEKVRTAKTVPLSTFRKSAEALREYDAKRELGTHDTSITNRAALEVAFKGLESNFTKDKAVISRKALADRDAMHIARIKQMEKDGLL